MAEDASISLTIRSLFRGEGFKKADKAIKDTARSARSASDAFQKVSASLGTLDGRAGKAATAVNGLLSSFAAGGAGGLAAAGIGIAFNFIIERIQAVGKKAEETARKMKEAFARAVPAIKAAFSFANGMRDANAAGRAGAMASLSGDANAAHAADVRAIRQNAAIAAAGLDPYAARLVTLRADVEAAKKARQHGIDEAEARRVQASMGLQSAVASRRALHKEAGETDETYKRRIARLEKDIAYYDADKAAATSFGGRATRWVNGKIYDLAMPKRTRDEAAAELEKARAERLQARQGFLLKGAQLDNDVAAKQAAVRTAAHDVERARADRSVEVAEAALAAEEKRQKDAKARAERLKKAEEDRARHVEDTNRKLKEYDAAISQARDEAAKQAALIADMQGAIAGGQSITDWERGRADAARERGGNLARARRNLLGKMDNARRRGNDAALAALQEKLDRLDGKNPAADRERELEAKRAELQRQSNEYLKRIAESMKGLGL